MKNIFIITFSFLISSLAFSQKDSKAQTILDKVSSELEQYKNIKIEFTHTLENKTVNIKQSSKGSAIIEGDKYVLNYLDNIILFDQKNNYVISPENEEVNITPASDISDDSISPSKLLNFYKKGYSYKLDKKEENIQFIKLTPTEKSEEVSFILLGINIQNSQIASLTEVGTNGTDTNFSITDYKTNQQLAPNTFAFNKAKYEGLGYYINE